MDFSLRPPPAVTINHAPLEPDPFEVEWSTRPRLAYRLMKSTTLQDWQPVAAWSDGTGDPFLHLAPNEGRAFFTVAHQPQEAPVDAAENAGFFLSYEDFGL